MVSAFSVPKAKRDDKILKNPGPGEYNPENGPKVVKNSDPNYSFGKDQRQSSINKIPGPGSYEPKSFVISEKNQNPSYSLGSRRELAQEKLPIGPGAYEPEFNYSKQKSPAFSIKGGRSNSININKVGPGDYEIKSGLDVNKSGYHFSKDLRSKNEKNGPPGPGSYEYENASFKYGSKQEPSYGFGAKLESRLGAEVPGPGTYEQNGKFSKIGGIISRDMHSSLIMSKTPGPGNYEHHFFDKEKNPGWSLSKSSRDQELKGNGVGPGQYQHDKNYKSVVQSSPGYHFGSDKKLRYDLGVVPGPGNYDGNLPKSRKGIRMGQKLADSHGLNVPGPGSYQDNQSWLKGRGRYSLGKSSRDELNKNGAPGPGAYDGKYDAARGKVTFGKDSRSKNDRVINPGPGHYDLKPTFADVPKYLLPDKH